VSDSELYRHLQTAIDHIAILNACIDELRELGCTVAVCGAVYDDAAARATLANSVVKDSLITDAPEIPPEIDPNAPLARLTLLADEMFEEWDRDNDMRVGKMLRALSGNLPGYRADIDQFRAALATTPAFPK
jgi:hypothetical protein